MKIFHFSDTHAGAPLSDWSALFDKRIAGFANYYFRRKHQHRQEVLSEFVEYALKEKPDVVICTGDITSTGQPDEFEKALGILDPLLRNPQIRFLYVPGNHDSYVWNEKCGNALRSSFLKLNGGNISLESLPLKLEIGGLNFVLVNESGPTSIMSSCGYLNSATSKKVIAICEEKTPSPIVLVGHFPVNERHPLLRLRKRLWGRKEVLKLLRSGGIKLSLCGHVHEPYKLVDDKGYGEICAGSLTKYKSAMEIDYDAASLTFQSREIKF